MKEIGNERSTVRPIRWHRSGTYRSFFGVSQKRFEFLRNGTEFRSAKVCLQSRAELVFSNWDAVKRRSYSENRQAAAAFLLNSVPEENGVKGTWPGSGSV